MNPKIPLTALAVLASAACANEALAGCNSPVIGCTAAQGCDPEVPAFPTVEPTRIVAQYHDQCGQEDDTWVYGRVGGSGSFDTTLRHDGFDSVGWRTATWSGLTPETTYCFRVRTRKDGIDRWSTISCKSTPPACPKPQITRFEEVGAGKIELRFADNCSGEASTTVWARKQSSSSWMSIRTDNGSVGGSRNARHLDLVPGEDYCYKVATYKLGRTHYSDEKCVSTQSLSASPKRAFRVDEVGGVGLYQDSTTGREFRPISTGAQHIEVSQPGQSSCASVLVRDASGDLMGVGNCSLDITLAAGRSYYIYPINGRSAEGEPARCDLSANGQYLGDMYCGWRGKVLDAPRRNEILEAVHLPPEEFLPPSASYPGYRPPSTAMLVLPTFAENGLTLVKHNGTARGSVHQLANDRRAVVVLVGFETTHALSQPMRLVRNDRLLADADGDSLGDQLEAAVFTCSRANESAGSYPCSYVHDLRDTDGDGLSDAWELLGRKTPSQLEGEDQPLPYWGASPVQKDLFLELDFAKKTDDGVPIKATAGAARLAARVWAFGNVTEEVRRSANAIDVENPNGQPGIRLHLDTGRTPEIVEDWTIYGDWGGHTVFELKDPPPQDGDPWVQPSEVWDTAMPEVRYGIFRHVLTYPTDGGQAYWGPTAGLGVAGDDDRTALLLTHEVGHSLGLDHASPWQLDSGSPGGVPGYDPEHGGPNCKPVYPSVMNYAFSDANLFGFADDYQLGFEPMNNLALVEEGALDHYWSNIVTPQSRSEILDFLVKRFGYHVDPGTGDVDWNRNGIFDTTPVRAGANNTGGNCDQGRINMTWLPETMVASRSLSLERYDGLIHAAWVDGDQVKTAAITVQRQCTDTSGGACVSISQHPYPPSMSVDDGADLERFDYTQGGQSRSLLGLAGVNAVGREILIRTYDSNSWSSLSILPTDGPGGVSIPVTGEPDLVRTPGLAGSDGKLLFRDAGGGVWISDVSIQGGRLHFGDILPVMLLKDGVTEQLVTDGESSPAAVFSYQPELSPSELQQQGSKSLHLITARGDDIYLTRLVDGSENEVVEVERVIDAVTPNGRTKPIWVTFDDQNEWNGALYVYAAGSDGTSVVLKGRYVDLDTPFGTFSRWVFKKFGVVDAHEVFAISAVFEQGADEQPRLLTARRVLDDDGEPTLGHGRLVLRPRPENIFDIDYRGFNDWLTLRYTICHHISKAFGRAAELGGVEVSCAAYPAQDLTHQRGL